MRNYSLLTNNSYLTLAACGGVITSANGVITSPNYPDIYPSHADCEWSITVAPHHSILLQMENLDIESFFDCTMDYVEAYEETDSQNNSYLFKLCGKLEANSINTWRTVSNQVLLHFHSDDTVFGNGFKLTFTEV